MFLKGSLREGAPQSGGGECDNMDKNLLLSIEKISESDVSPGSFRQPDG